MRNYYLLTKGDLHVRMQEYDVPIVNELDIYEVNNRRFLLLIAMLLKCNVLTHIALISFWTQEPIKKKILIKSYLFYSQSLFASETFAFLIYCKAFWYCFYCQKKKTGKEVDKHSSKRFITERLMSLSHIFYSLMENYLKCFHNKNFWTLYK